MGVSDDRFLYKEEKRNQLYQEAGYFLKYIKYYQPKVGEKNMTFELKDKDLENVTGGSILPYLVEAGDTLAMIAKKFNCTVEELQRWNKIENIDKIDVGQKLIIKF